MSSLDLPRNDLELANAMRTGVHKAVYMLLEYGIKGDVEDIIVSLVGRGSGIYKSLNRPTRVGAFSKAWTVDKGQSQRMFRKPRVLSGGTIAFATHGLYYDNSKLDRFPIFGAHTTPLYKNIGIGDEKYGGGYSLGYPVHSVKNGGDVTNLFELLDKGGGGMFFGEDNPTRKPLNVSRAIKAHLDSHFNSYINEAFDRFL